MGSYAGGLDGDKDDDDDDDDGFETDDSPMPTSRSFVRRAGSSYDSEGEFEAEDTASQQCDGEIGDTEETWDKSSQEPYAADDFEADEASDASNICDDASEVDGC